MTFTSADITRFLGTRIGDTISPYLPAVLLDPANDLLGRGSKNLRGQLVRIGFSCGLKQEQRYLQLGQQLMERLHAGSLIVDDIEDDSALRRGEPCLHRKFGTPVALNTGNWLYFWPLYEASEVGLTAATELELYRRYHRTLLSAHIGQALDVGIRIDEIAPENMHDLCLASLELKSGALTSLGLVVGALLSSADAPVLRALDVFGTRFGVALQMFDDIGNFRGQKDPSKKFEDLKLRRPSWIWALMAKRFPDRLAGFREVVQKLPDTGPVEAWASLNDDVLCEAKAESIRFLNEALGSLGDSGVPVVSQEALKGISTQLMGAYE